MYQYTVDKAHLIPFQLEQFEKLKQNKSSFEKDLKFFPKNMQIEESGNQIIFSFTVEQQKRDEWQENLVPQLGDQYIPRIRYLIDLMMTFKDFGIHLPTFEITQSIVFYDESIQVSLEVYKSQNKVIQGFPNQLINLGEFCLQQLTKDNVKLPWQCMAYELVTMIVEGGEIKIDEKMSVFCFGCAMYFLQNKHHLFLIDGLEDINERRTELLTRIEMKVLSLNFDRALYTGLLMRCVQEDPNQRPTLEQVKQEVDRISYFISITCGAIKEQQNKVNPFLLFKENKLHSIVIDQLKLKNDEQITGRIYIMQNLAKLKFIVHLFRSDIIEQNNAEKEYIVQLLLTNLICTQIEELQKLEVYIGSKKSNTQSIPLEFNDTIDELQEFKGKYYENYKLLLLRMYSYFLSLEVYNSQFDEYYSIQTQDLKSIIVKLKTYIHNNPQGNLLKYCLDNLSTIFYHDQLKMKFSPVIQELLKVDTYDEYDCLFTILLDKNKSQLHTIIYQKISEN